MHNLTHFDGDIGIRGNNALESLYGLQNIGPVVQGLGIGGGAALTNLAGLENITTVTGNVAVGGPALENLNGLHNLVSVGGLLEISNNLLISDLTGLDSLHSAKHVRYNR